MNKPRVEIRREIASERDAAFELIKKTILKYVYKKREIIFSEAMYGEWVKFVNELTSSPVSRQELYKHTPVQRLHFLLWQKNVDAVQMRVIDALALK